MLKNEKQDRRDSREVKIEWGAREAVDLPNGGLHHEFTGSSWKECNSSSLQQVDQDDTFYGNHRRNISGKFSEVV